MDFTAKQSCLFQINFSPVHARCKVAKLDLMTVIQPTHNAMFRRQNHAGSRSLRSTRHRFEDREAPTIVEPTDAIIRIAVTCVCGSDLWGRIEGCSRSMARRQWRTSTAESSSRGQRGEVYQARSVRHRLIRYSDNKPHCHCGHQSSCVKREFIGRAQAPVLRVPLAHGTLVPTPGFPSDDLLASLLTTSDALGTDWFAAGAANVKPESTVAVIGDGAVGLLAIFSTKQMGAERIIAMSRHETRQKLAREFGAIDIVTERGDEGVARTATAASKKRDAGERDPISLAVLLCRPRAPLIEIGVRSWTGNASVLQSLDPKSTTAD